MHEEDQFKCSFDYTIDDGYDNDSIYQDLGYHDDESNSQFDITDHYLDEDDIRNHYVDEDDFLDKTEINNLILEIKDIKQPLTTKNEHHNEIEKEDASNLEPNPYYRITRILSQ